MNEQIGERMQMQMQHYYQKRRKKTETETETNGTKNTHTQKLTFKTKIANKTMINVHIFKVYSCSIFYFIHQSVCFFFCNYVIDAERGNSHLGNRFFIKLNINVLVKLCNGGAGLHSACDLFLLDECVHRNYYPGGFIY